MPHQAIALVGATGHLGPYILRALLSSTSPRYTVTAIVRPASTSASTLPSSVEKLTLPEDPTAENLTPLLQGQDALIVTLPPGANKPLQFALAEAAYAAGVKLFIPADFGSCDSADERVLERVDIYRAKAEVREHLRGLVARGERE